MAQDKANNIDRRVLLTRSVPACAAACIGLCRFPGVAALTLEPRPQDPHKFDVPRDRRISPRRLAEIRHERLLQFIRVLQGELDEPELLRLLRVHSAVVGRLGGEAQRRRSPDTSFRTFVAEFRPPRYADILTHDVVRDTGDVFELRVIECVNATVFRDAGMDGEIGHAAVSNMDYHWPAAFKPDFRMERSKTLMQGHNCCNHRYINSAATDSTAG
jgi:hypothetical protein